MTFEAKMISDLISEISMGPFGSNIKVECFVDQGIPVLNGSNLEGFVLKEDSFRYVTEEKADSLGKANAHRGDVVITHRGTLGQIVFIPENSNYDRYVISQSQFRVKCNNLLLPEYLVYYFHTRIGQHKLLSNASQVGVPALARASTTFQTIEIEVPSISEQRKIVNILETIRKKIELNSRINENLEQQAQALFKSWFIDFEPFDGATPSTWKRGILGDIATISTASFSPLKNPDVTVEHYSIPAYDEKQYPVFEIASGIKSNKYLVSPTSVLISKLNPDTKRIWRPYCLSELPICSTEFIVYEPNNPSERDYVYSVIDSDSFSKFLCSHTTGSTNSRQRAVPSVTLNYELLIPDSGTIEHFCSIVSPMYDLMKKGAIESQKLATLRDQLLPKLMSGELDVSEIDL